MANDSLAVVLGGAGFLGSHLVEALLGQGRRVRVFDRTHVDLRNLQNLRGDWDFVGGDFLSESDQRLALDGAGTVFHLISTTLPATSNQDPVFDVETNLLASVRMFELARVTGVEKVVFVSSGGTVYGRPVDLPIKEEHPTDPLVSYGVIKLGIEKYLGLYHHQHGLGHRVLRLSNPYGPRQDPAGAQGAASVFLGHVHEGQPIEIWGDGSVIRDYIYVADAVAGILAAEAHPRTGTYNIGSGHGVSINGLVETIRQVAAREFKVEYLPGRPFDVPANVLDITRARDVLGWSPETSLEAGLAATWSWLEGNQAG